MVFLERGDIIINPQWPGHVMMVHTEGSRIVARGKVQDDNYAKIIHANNAKGFHVQTNQVDTNGNIGYLYESTKNWLFRPKWDQHPQIEKDKWLEGLIDVAEAMAKSAVYGKYRATRLFLGSQTFGTAAANRLKKYVGRYQGIQQGASPTKFVTTVTCSESVILSYQINNAVKGNGPTIKLDAAHTMPNDLKTHLSNSSNWETVNQPS